MHVPQCVVVEKVDVERRLNEPRDPHNPVVMVVRFGGSTVHPVEQVECAVGPEQEHIVSCEVLHLLKPLQHNQLRHNRDGFEVDGKGPQNLWAQPRSETCCGTRRAVSARTSIGVNFWLMINANTAHGTIANL